MVLFKTMAHYPKMLLYLLGITDPYSSILYYTCFGCWSWAGRSWWKRWWWRKEMIRDIGLLKMLNQRSNGAIDQAGANLTTLSPPVNTDYSKVGGSWWSSLRTWNNPPAKSKYQVVILPSNLSEFLWKRLSCFLRFPLSPTSLPSTEPSVGHPKPGQWNLGKPTSF